MHIIEQFKVKLADTMGKLKALDAELKAKDVKIADMGLVIQEKNNEIGDLRATITALNPEKLNARIDELLAQVAEMEKAFADAMGAMDGEAPSVPSAGNIDDSPSVPSAGDIED